MSTGRLSATPRTAEPGRRAGRKAPASPAPEPAAWSALAFDTVRVRSASASVRLARECEDGVWEAEQGGALWYETREEAERRRDALVRSGRSAGDLRVASFRSGEARRWRVEICRRGAPGAAPRRGEAPARPETPPPPPRPTPRAGVGIDDCPQGPEGATRISSIDVDLSGSVTIHWQPAAGVTSVPDTTANASVGAGRCDIDCSTQASRPDSRCTRMGSSTGVQSYVRRMTSHPEAEWVSWFNLANEVAFHYYPSHPRGSVSNGCVRLGERVAKLIYCYSRVGTPVSLSGTWRRGNRCYTYLAADGTRLSEPESVSRAENTRRIAAERRRREAEERRRRAPAPAQQRPAVQRSALPRIARTPEEPAPPPMTVSGDSVRENAKGVGIQNGTLTWKLRYVGRDTKVEPVPDKPLEFNFIKGQDVVLEATFTPTAGASSCPTVTFVQTVLPTTGGLTDTGHLLYTRDPATGASADVLGEATRPETEPFYGAGPKAGTPGLFADSGQTTTGAAAGASARATHGDAPYRMNVPKGTTVVRSFESAVTCVESAETFGSLSWGYTKSDAGVVTLTGGTDKDVRTAGASAGFEAVRAAFYPGFFQLSLADFARGSETLTPAHKALLDGLDVKELSRAILVGANDNSGGGEAKPELSQKRADAAKDYLVKTRGVADALVKTEGHGVEARVPNPPGKEVGANRRVDVHVQRGKDTAKPAVARPGSASESKRLSEQNPRLTVDEAVNEIVRLSATKGPVPSDEWIQLDTMLKALDVWRAVDPTVPDLRRLYARPIADIKGRSPINLKLPRAPMPNLGPLPPELEKVWKDYQDAKRRVEELEKERDDALRKLDEERREVLEEDAGPTSSAAPGAGTGPAPATASAGASSATAGSTPTPDQVSMLRAAISFLGDMKSAIASLRRLAGFEIAEGEKKAAAEPAMQHAHRATAAEKANKLLSQKVLRERLTKARSVYDAQRTLVDANDPLQGELRQAYAELLGELRAALDEALDAVKNHPGLRETEPVLYGGNLVLWLEASPFTKEALGTRTAFTGADVAASTLQASNVDEVLKKLLPFVNLVEPGGLARARAAVRGALTTVGADAAGGRARFPAAPATVAKADALVAQLDAAEAAIALAVARLKAGSAAVAAWAKKPDPADTTGSALATYFKIADAGYAQLLADRLALLGRQLEGGGELFAHVVAPGDWTCGSPDVLGQYRRPYEFVFCGRFAGAEKDAATLIHEVAHAVVPARGSKPKVAGGIPLDRAYPGERMLAFLSTEEALANAESYVQLVWALAGAGASLKTIPVDTTLGCDAAKGSPPDAVTKAVATAQVRIRRLDSWVGDWLAEFGRTKAIPADARTAATAYFGALTDAEIEKVLRSVSSMPADATAFPTSQALTCDVAGKACPSGRVAWNDAWTFALGAATKRSKALSGATRAVCPDFFALTEDERARVALGVVLLRPGTTYIFQPEKIFKYAEWAEATWKSDIPAPAAASLAEHQAADTAASPPSTAPAGAGTKPKP